MKTKPFGFAALLAVGALTLAACGGGDSDSSSTDTASPTSTSDSSPTGEPIADCGTINFLQPLPESIIFWPLITSNALGYFADEGMEVNLLPGGDLPETAFVENGEADIASAGGPEVMQAINAGADLKVVYDYWNVAAEGLVTLIDGPNSATEVQTVGLVTDSDAATVEIIWSSLGLDPASVDVITLGETPAILAEALENGTVDAIAGAISDFIGISASGVQIKDIAPEDFKASPSASFIVTPDSIADNAACIQGFLRAWAKGTYAGLVNPEATQAMGKAAVPEEWLDEATGVASYEQSVPFQEPVGSDGLFGVVQKAVWQAQADELIAIGALNNLDSLDVSTFIDEQFVPGANEWDRAAVEADTKAWAEANQ
ncbi:MAG: ABC transporter substrate-binding protein [Actinomycetes bacterium]